MAEKRFLGQKYASRLCRYPVSKLLYIALFPRFFVFKTEIPSYAEIQEGRSLSLCFRHKQVFTEIQDGLQKWQENDFLENRQ